MEIMPTPQLMRPCLSVASFHFATGFAPAPGQINDINDRRMHKYTTRPMGTYTPLPYCTESSPERTAHSHSSPLTLIAL